jgi:hypothetical protein
MIGSHRAAACDLQLEDDEFPKKNIYFIEQSVNDRRGGAMMNLSRPVSRIMIGVSRNWSKNILLWNLAVGPNAGHILMWRMQWVLRSSHDRRR